MRLWVNKRTESALVERWQLPVNTRVEGSSIVKIKNLAILFEPKHFAIFLKKPSSTAEHNTPRISPLAERWRIDLHSAN